MSKRITQELSSLSLTPTANGLDSKAGPLVPNDPMRYITIMLDESKTKIFGLNRVDLTRPYTLQKVLLIVSTSTMQLLWQEQMLIGVHW